MPIHFERLVIIDNNWSFMAMVSLFLNLLQNVLEPWSWAHNHPSLYLGDYEVKRVNSDNLTGHDWPKWAWLADFQILVKIEKIWQSWPISVCEHLATLHNHLRYSLGWIQAQNQCSATFWSKSRNLPTMAKNDQLWPIMTSVGVKYTWFQLFWTKGSSVII